MEKIESKAKQNVGRSAGSNKKKLLNPHQQ